MHRHWNDVGLTAGSALFTEERRLSGCQNPDVRVREKVETMAELVGCGYGKSPRADRTLHDPSSGPSSRRPREWSSVSSGFGGSGYDQSRSTLRCVGDDA